MLLKKITECKLGDNDAYFLEVVADKILINHDYQKLQVYTTDLMPAAEISLPDEISIYRSYSNDQLGISVLYCPEQECLVYLSLPMMYAKLIELTDESLLSPIHCWDGSHLVVGTYQGQFYVISGSGAISLTVEQVQRDYPALFDLWALSTGLEVREIGLPLCVANVDKVGLVLHSGTGGNKRFNMRSVGYHAFCAHGDHLLCLSEERLDLVTEKGEETHISPGGNRIYLRAKFLEGTEKIALLSSDRADVRSNWLEVYEILE